MRTEIQSSLPKSPTMSPPRECLLPACTEAIWLAGVLEENLSKVPGLPQKGLHEDYYSHHPFYPHAGSRKSPGEKLLPHHTDKETAPERVINTPRATKSMPSLSPPGPLTNMAPGSHPEHLFGLQALQLIQGRWLYRPDLNGDLLGSNSVQSHSVLLLEAGIPESKGERESLSELPL